MTLTSDAVQQGSVTNELPISIAAVERQADDDIKTVLMDALEQLSTPVPEDMVTLHRIYPEIEQYCKGSIQLDVALRQMEAV